MGRYDRETWTVEFTVTGTGPFPFDMLRFDECWPASITDAIAMERASQAGHAHRESINLRAFGFTRPTLARWDSFGWKVSHINGEPAVAV